MAERLTKKITKTIQSKYSLGSYLYYDFNGAENTNRLLNKLGKLEDIMEKYGIDVEKLDKELSISRLLHQIIAELSKMVTKAENERDTWQKACELACRHIAEVEWLSCPETDDISESENEIKTLTKQALNCFYQQAKTEGNDE